MKAFQRKLKFRQKQPKAGDLSYFTTCKKLTEEDWNGNEALLLLRSEKYTNVFKDVKREFQRQFSDFRLHEFEFMLFSNPFSLRSKKYIYYCNMQLKLLKVHKISELKSSFRDLPLDKFYSSVPASTYAALRKHASRIASLFGSIYICEKTFSVTYFNKSKWETALTDEHLQSFLQFSTT